MEAAKGSYIREDRRKDRRGSKRQVCHPRPGPPVAGTRREPERGSHGWVRAPSRRPGRGSTARRGAGSHTVRADGTRHTGTRTLRRAGAEPNLCRPQNARNDEHPRPGLAGQRPGSVRVARRGRRPARPGAAAKAKKSRRGMVSQPGIAGRCGRSQLRSERRGTRCEYTAAEGGWTHTHNPEHNIHNIGRGGTDRCVTEGWQTESQAGGRRAAPGPPAVRAKGPAGGPRDDAASSDRCQRRESRQLGRGRWGPRGGRARIAAHSARAGGAAWQATDGPPPHAPDPIHPRGTLRWRAHI